MALTRVTPDDYEAIVLGYTSGMTMQTLGVAFGVSRERIRQHLRKLGVHQRNPCEIEECTNRVAANSPDGMLCVRHGWQLRRYGDPRQQHAKPRLLKYTVHGTLQCYRKGGPEGAGCRCDECMTTYRQYWQNQRQRRYGRPADVPHGTSSGYVNWGCRCKPCKRAADIARSAEKAKLTARGREHPELIPHGTWSSYLLWNCRCDVCVAFYLPKKKKSPHPEG